MKPTVCLSRLVRWSPLLALTAALAAFARGADNPPLPSLADVLPPQSLCFYQLPDPAADVQNFKQSVIGAFYEHPDVAAFRADYTKEQDAFINRVAAESRIEPNFIRSVLMGRKSYSLIDFAVDDAGEVQTSFVVSIELPTAPDPKRLFDAIRTIVRELRKRFGQETDATKLIKDAAWEENWPGGHNIMVIALQTPIRCVLLGKTVLVFRGGSDSLKALLANYDNLLTATTLARSPLYEAVAQGAGLEPGLSFLYVNTARVYSLLGALRQPKVTRLLDALGLNSVQALGYTLGFAEEGMRHTLYMHAPHERRGILNVLGQKTNAELAAQELPAESGGILAARVDLPTLYRELPNLVDAAEAALNLASPSNLGNLAGQQTFMGLPPAELLSPLGTALILERGPAGVALRFDMADVAACRAVIARIEKELGAGFTQLAVKTAKGEVKQVCYLNHTGHPLPVAPAYCIARQNGNMGTIYIASHPQVLVAILRQPEGQTLHQSADYQRVIKGLGGGYGVFLYLNAQESFIRVYDALLPILNVCTASPFLAFDPGKLPPGNELAPYLFGLGIGIRNSRAGVTMTAYSPIGQWGLAVLLLDKLVISNPASLGVLAAQLSSWSSAGSLFDAARNPGKLLDNLGDDTGAPAIPGEVRPNRNNDGGLPPIGK